MAATIQMITAMAFFAVTHSLFARLPIKAWMRKHMGERPYEAFYRIGYSIFSVVTFAPVMYILLFNSGADIWSLSGIWAILFRLLQLTGLIGLTVSALQIELGRFAGLTQVHAYLNGKALPLPPEDLNTRGVYLLVRHPLYFFSLLVLWFTPHMTETGLVFVITATLYFIFGSLLEERTMRHIFGEPYEHYQQRVPWMIPFTKFNRSNMNNR